MEVLHSFHALSARSLLLLMLMLSSITGTLPEQSPNTIRFFGCNNQTYASNSSYQHSLELLLTTLQDASSASLYNATAVGSGDARVYGMIQCRGDLTLPDCYSCVSYLIDTCIPQNCPRGISMQMWLDGCYLRYKNQSFTGIPVYDLYYYSWNVDNTTTDSSFKQNRDSALEIVTTSAPRNGHLYNSTAVGVEDTSQDRVYALAQCFGYLSQQECSGCLGNVSKTVKQLIDNNRGGKVYYGSCYARYETYNFVFSSYTPSPSPLADQQHINNAGNTSKRKVAVIVGIVVAGSVVLFVLLLIVCRMRVRPRYLKGNHNVIENLGDKASPMVKEFNTGTGILQYSLHDLERATDFFSEENKLGEGGFGPVYKGKLDNGQQIAIKKLSSGNHHGVQQFLNEMKVLTSVQHRNLITFLGCCIEVPHKMLVYEYASNGSLDMALYGSRYLSWQTRLDIILGIAKGLAYLHNDSPVHIVHRDIKPSNILLDEQMTPMIADFGLARLFTDDVSRIITGIAGTWGYLAPEYAIHGQLTEKVDTFSFGVVTLEIVSGRRNMDPKLPDEQIFMEWVWRLYKDHRELEIIDPLLMNHFPPHEVLQVIHVALLCVQMHAELRPSMQNVVTLLSSQSDTFSIPTAPAVIQSYPQDAFRDEASSVATMSVSSMLSPSMPSSDESIISSIVAR